MQLLQFDYRKFWKASFQSMYSSWERQFLQIMCVLQGTIWQRNKWENKYSNNTCSCQKQDDIELFYLFIPVKCLLEQQIHSFICLLWVLWINLFFQNGKKLYPMTPPSQVGGSRFNPRSCHMGDLTWVIIRMEGDLCSLSLKINFLWTKE